MLRDNRELGTVEANSWAALATVRLSLSSSTDPLTPKVALTMNEVNL